MWGNTKKHLHLISPVRLFVRPPCRTSRSCISVAIPPPGLPPSTTCPRRTRPRGTSRSSSLHYVPPPGLPPPRRSSSFLHLQVFLQVSLLPPPPGLPPTFHLQVFLLPPPPGLPPPPLRSTSRSSFHLQVFLPPLRSTSRSSSLHYAPPPLCYSTSRSSSLHYVPAAHAASRSVRYFSGFTYSP